jgi:hypothetical protein
VPRAERLAARVPGAAELVANYEAWLAVDGHGSLSYRNAAWSFLARWPDPAEFAEEALDVQESLGRGPTAVRHLPDGHRAATTRL